MDSAGEGENKFRFEEFFDLKAEVRPEKDKRVDDIFNLH